MNELLGGQWVQLCDIRCEGSTCDLRKPILSLHGIWEIRWDLLKELAPPCSGLGNGTVLPGPENKRDPDRVPCEVVGLSGKDSLHLRPNNMILRNSLCEEWAEIGVTDQDPIGQEVDLPIVSRICAESPLSSLDSIANELAKAHVLPT